MARTEAKLNCMALAQQCDADYWNWTDDELKYLGQANAMTAIICDRLTKSGCVIDSAYGIVHDKDSRLVWSEQDMKEIIDMKPSHIHVVVKFENGKGDTLPNLAMSIGVEPQYVEKAGKGKFGYDNLLSYLTHIKHTEKHQYSPTDVVTLCGKDYSLIYEDRKVDWLKGRAKLQADKASANIDYLEEMILHGEVTKSQVLLTDEYYDVYSRNSRRCEDAFSAYGERRAYKTLRDMEDGKFKTSVLFVQGESGSGKTYFTKGLVASLITESVANGFDAWRVCQTAASNPMDDYSGEEILWMDDVRGAAMSASDWLKLLDPENISPASARYKNKVPACRVVLITSTKDPLEFFYYCKQMGGGDRSEAMDQFLRRIMASITVYRVPNTDDRYVSIGHNVRTDEHMVSIPNTMSKLNPAAREQVMINHEFVEVEPFDEMPQAGALKYITGLVMNRNKLDESREVI